MNFNISDVSTTKMTSKGQVVIPEEIREHMNLEPGVKFLIMASEDSIIFKKINPLPKSDIRALLVKSHAMAKEYGITEDDILQDIAEVRRMRRIKTGSGSAAKKLVSNSKRPILKTKSTISKTAKEHPKKLKEKGTDKK